MNKKTKRTRRNMKKKTRKYYGGFIDKGSQGKPEVEQNDSTQKVEQKMNEIGDAASGTVSDVKKVIDKGSSAVIENINEVLKSPHVGNYLNESVTETAAIGTKLLENFNENFNTPGMKEQTEKALENSGQYAEIALKAMDKPIDIAIDKLSKSGEKAASAAFSGSIKVLTDGASAIPGVGAFIGLGKLANDASKAVGNIVEATSEATDTIRKFQEETNKNIDKELSKLEEKKDSINDFNQLTKDKLNVANRVNKSINEFEKPSIIGGSNTRRNFSKRNCKTKRVRFAI